MTHADSLQPAYCLIKPVILEMEPLSDAHVVPVVREPLERALWCAVLAQQAHVEMPIVRRSFRLLVPRRRLPGHRQIVEAVPMNAWRAPYQQFGGAIDAPGLH